ncbi:MAG: M28 family peptidase [Blastocatellia bacterium]
MQMEYIRRGLLIGLVVLAGLAGLALTVEGQQRKKRSVRTRPAAVAVISAETRSVLDTISAPSLRGHLAFLASDQLEGRNTPSKGLDIAAEYIAAQMMRAGLQPGVASGDGAGPKSYYQVAQWQVTEPSLDSFELAIVDGGVTHRIAAGRVSFQTEQPVEVSNLPLLKLVVGDAGALAGLKSEQVAGKAVIVEFPEPPRDDRARMMEAFRTRNQIIGQINALKPGYLLAISRTAEGRGLGGGRLIDPERAGSAAGSRLDSIPTVHDPRLVALYDEMKPGETRGSFSFRLAAPKTVPVALRNVIGVVPGSDPVLRDSYVIVSAHYDHIGIGQGSDGDKIYNGANDDASGTVSVIELGAALSRLRIRPKRTLVFITWFGEEKGLLGSRYYGRHPVFPLAKTVAMVNLEQVGRTDSSEGPQVSNATLTGFDFTDLGPIFKAAGDLTGINVYKHEKNSDAFFGRSDNQALADAGIPAHTLCTAFVYPDYHQAGDHWEKVDYENMARVNRMVALALINIGNNPQAPKWNEANPKTARYVEAWKKLKPAE